MTRWTDLATWRGPTANRGGAMVEQRGLVIHIAEGSYEGTIAWQKNPAAEVSSHFVTDLDGAIAQVVDTDVTAWTQQAGNGHWVSVENAGHTPGPLTDAQCDAIARLYARGHRQYGWPLQLANGSSGRGLGHHSMGGTAWGHLDCPGPAIIAQKPVILTRAIQIVNGGQPAPATPSEDDMRMIVDTSTSVYLMDGTDPAGHPVLIPISVTAQFEAYKAAGIPVTTIPGLVNWSYYAKGPLPASGGGGTGPAPGGPVDLTDAAVTKVAAAVVDLEHDRLAG